MHWETFSSHLTALAQTHTHLVRRSASREEVAVVVAMNGQVEDVGVIVERLLGAVAVVNVLRSESTHGTITNCVQKTCTACPCSRKDQRASHDPSGD